MPYITQFYVFSDDSKEYDPSDFDFTKIDAAERLRDTLPAPAIRTVNKPAPAASTNEYSGTFPSLISFCYLMFEELEFSPIMCKAVSYTWCKRMGRV